MKLTIGFSRAKSPLKIGSWIIRKYLGTEYSHVFMDFYSEKLERSIVYEAVGSGVRFIGKNTWDTHATVIKEYTIEITPDQYKRLMQFCVDTAGAEYGIMQNIGLAIAKTFNLKKNPFKKGLNCSELVFLILSETGYSMGINRDLITPKDIDFILSKQI